MVNPLSMTTTPVELRKCGKVISRGTGFYYRSQWEGVEQIFLVTNHHVLTGNIPRERDLAPQGDSVVFYYHTESKNPGAVVGIETPIFTKSGKQIWIEHPNAIVDIAVIPMVFSFPMTPEWHTVDKTLAAVDLDISISDPVTLVGYPRMYLDEKNALPIYKTGNIASEYDYDFNGDPCFIIDIAALHGNSGSPLFAIQKNARIVSDRILINAPGSVTKFLGVYSAGVVGKKFIPIQEVRNNGSGVVMDIDLQLGVVWRAFLIEEALSQNILKDYEVVARELVVAGGFKYKLSTGLRISNGAEGAEG